MATEIYHITHISNLPNIIHRGGLLSDAQISSEGDQVQGIAYNHIKERRLRTLVPVPPGGVVGDYVPFYFAARSPMLFTIFKGNVEHYTDGQESIVYLVADVHESAENTQFCFCNGHATMSLTGFHNRLEELDDSIDWQIMRAKYWGNTDEDGDRTRRRQAEFLIKDFFPWNLVKVIGVYDKIKARMVETILDKSTSPHRPSVLVKTAWYYQ